MDTIHLLIATARRPDSDLFNEVASSSIKFSDSIETQLNQYFEKQTKVATMPLAFGRLEFEEYLVE